MVINKVSEVKRDSLHSSDLHMGYLRQDKVVTLPRVICVCKRKDCLVDFNGIEDTNYKSFF